MSDPFSAPSNVSVAGPQGAMRLRRVGVLSCGIFSGAAGVLIGLIASLFFAFFAALGVGLGGARGPGVMEGAGAGLMMLIFFPMMYGFFGFIGGLLNAVIYNILAGMTGGIQMEFTPDQ